MRRLVLSQLSVLALASFSVVGCTDRAGSIGIMSISPLESTDLGSGEAMSSRVAFRFSLAGKSGSARMYVQSDDQLLGRDEVSLYGRSGTAMLETSFTVPASGSVVISVALFEQGQEESVVTDRIEYEIQGAANAR